MRCRAVLTAFKTAVRRRSTVEDLSARVVTQARHVSREPIVTLKYVMTRLEHASPRFATMAFKTGMRRTSIVEGTLATHVMTG